MIFYVGLHKPRQARHFDHVMVSANRMLPRRKGLGVRCNWILDSGAFTEIATHGRYRSSVEEYASLVRRWQDDHTLAAAVAQDWMCESFILQKTGLSIPEHQRLTIERYDELVARAARAPIMPVLQGYRSEDYSAHLEQYGQRLSPGALVGIGSICKRNTDAGQIEHILTTIKRSRPDLRLHGFGLKLTALGSGVVRDCLHSCDSMAWSFAARRQGRNQNSHLEAQRFVNRINTMPVQLGWSF